MGVLDVPPAPWTKAAPLITSPTISDSSSIYIVGISNDGTTLYGADQTSGSSGQFYTSTDDGNTWSSGWMSTPFTQQVQAIAETATGELLISIFNPVGGQGRLYITNGWPARTVPAVWGSYVLQASAVNNWMRPWNLGPHMGSTGGFMFVVEYGGQSAANSARYAWCSTDYGKSWVKVYDLFSTVAGVMGPGYDSTPSTGYHNLGHCLDPWTGRVWVSAGNSDSSLWYSDDVSGFSSTADGIVTSGNLSQLSSASTGLNVFNALDVGKVIIANVPPNGAALFPAGTTITGIVNKYTVSTSNAASGAVTGLAVGWGSSTWKRAFRGPVNQMQTGAMIAGQKAIYFGSDGYPQGVNAIRKAPGSPANSPIQSRLNVGNSYQSHAILMSGMYQAPWLSTAPILGALTSGPSPALETFLVGTVDEEEWFVIYQQATASSGQGFIGNVYGPTALGNIVATINNPGTGSGWFTFRAPMPVFPNVASWYSGKP
jgi:hypothetical protein